MHEPSPHSTTSPTPRSRPFQFSLRTMLLLLAGLTILVGGCHELFRLRTVANYFEYRVNMFTRELYAPEQPVDLRPQGRQNAFPQFTAHLNSEACLERMRAEFSDFAVSQVWTQENVEFSAYGMASVVPCQISVDCELPVPGHRARDLMRTSSSRGVDEALIREFEARFEAFAMRELEEFCARQEQGETTTPSPGSITP